MADSLLEAVELLHKILAQRGETPVEREFVNNNRNYILVTQVRPYILKWDTGPFGQAGARVPEIGKGRGLTIDLGTFVTFRNRFPDGWVTYNWTGIDKIYYQHGEFVDQLGGVYEHPNGEWVKVINIRSAKLLSPLLD